LKVKFIKHPKNDYLPPAIMGEPVVIELAGAFVHGTPNSKYWLRCHKCGCTGNLSAHDVLIEDGLVTLHPSVICPNPECKAHYFIRKGEIC